MVRMLKKQAQGLIFTPTPTIDPSVDGILHTASIRREEEVVGQNMGQRRVRVGGCT